MTKKTIIAVAILTFAALGTSVLSLSSKLMSAKAELMRSDVVIEDLRQKNEAKDLIIKDISIKANELAAAAKVAEIQLSAPVKKQLDACMQAEFLINRAIVFEIRRGIEMRAAQEAARKEHERRSKRKT